MNRPTAADPAPALRARCDFLLNRPDPEEERQQRLNDTTYRLRVRGSIVTARTRRPTNGRSRALKLGAYRQRRISSTASTRAPSWRPFTAGRDWSLYIPSLDASGASCGILLAIQLVSPGALEVGDVKLGRSRCLPRLGGLALGVLRRPRQLRRPGTARHGRATSETRMPFGPALIVGTLSVLALHTMVPIGATCSDATRPT